MMASVIRIAVSYAIGAIVGEIAVKGLKEVTNKIKEIKSEKEGS